jgi:Leucine-rich repeat (LRR) protein
MATTDESQLYAHGPDTPELLERMATIEENTLYVSDLHITSLPELPEGLKKLYCSDTRIRVLPKLPSTLTLLSCYNTPLTELPELPSGLILLSFYGTHISRLPELPDGLTHLIGYKTRLESLPKLPSSLIRLWVDTTPLTALPDLPPDIYELSFSRTPIQILPEFPERLEFLIANNTHLGPKRLPGESVADFNRRYRPFREEIESKRRTQERTVALKEDLMAAVWSPARLETHLEQGGWDVVEGM